MTHDTSTTMTLGLGAEGITPDAYAQQEAAKYLPLSVSVPLVLLMTLAAILLQ